MENIIDMLHKGEFSCVMKNREEIRTFTQRGVADLYDLYQTEPAFMKGASIADKVIGKGAGCPDGIGRIQGCLCRYNQQSGTGIAARSRCGSNLCPGSTSYY